MAAVVCDRSHGLLAPCERHSSLASPIHKFGNYQFTSWQPSAARLIIIREQKQSTTYTISQPVTCEIDSTKNIEAVSLNSEKFESKIASPRHAVISDGSTIGDGSNDCSVNREIGFVSLTFAFNRLH